MTAHTRNMANLTRLAENSFSSKKFNTVGNPSGLLKLRWMYNIGALTKEEHIKFRKIAMGVNVYEQRI